MSILADQNPVFQRAMRVISSITNDYPAVVTTTFAHQYLTGLIVRLNIPKGYGMTQANQLYGPIIVTGDSTFTIDIDTTYFDPFISQQNVGTTDALGSASGTISGTDLLVGLGQTFYIGNQVFTVVVPNGSMVTRTVGVSTGTMDLATGDFAFTGTQTLTDIFWLPVSFPYSYQYPQVVPLAETNDILSNATQNVLPYSAT